MIEIVAELIFNKSGADDLIARVDRKSLRCGQNQFKGEHVEW